MNLNKYTKAELISKFKKLETKSNFNQNPIINKINNYFNQLWILILTFKNILLKLTLISLLINIFKKYRIFRRIWTLLNTIIVSIFGISLIDNFGIEFLSNFIKETKIITYSIISYLSETHFYKYLSELFSVKEDIPSNEATNKNGSISSIKRKEERITEESGKNSKISEWIKPEQSENKPEIKSEETTYKKYYIIATVVIISSLAYYYSDEIKEGTISLIEWILSFRPGTPDDGGGNTNNSSTPTSMNIQRPIKKVTIPDPIDSEQSSPEIELIDKGKGKMLTSPSLEELSSNVADYWSKTQNSPDSSASTSSTETITPSKLPIISDSSGSINPSSPDPESSSTETVTPLYYSNNTGLESMILSRISREWKNMLPKLMLNKIIFIESNLEHNNSNFEIRKQMIDTLSDIETDLWKQIKYVSDHKRYLSETELLQLNFQIELINKWIREYHDKIFS